MAESYTPEQVIELLQNTLGEGMVAYPRGLARYCGGHLAAIFLQQCLHWSKTEVVKKRGGWFWKTGKDWKTELQFTRDELETARRKNRERGFIQERKAGNPARLYFRVVMPNVVAALLGQAKTLSLEEIIDIHRPALANLSKSAYARAKRIAKSTGARVENVNLRDVLVRDNGICQLCRKTITHGPGEEADCCSFDHKLELGKGGDHTPENIIAVHVACNSQKEITRRQAESQFAENQQTSLQSFSKQVRRKSANKFAGFQHAKLSETTALNYALNPPTPFTVDFSLTPPAPQPEELPEPDSRFPIVKEAIRKCWPPAVPWSWSPRDDHALSDLLALPGWTAEALTDCIAFRFLSEVNHAERPARWLDRVTEYALGPRDRFKALKPGTVEEWRAHGRRFSSGKSLLLRRGFL